jgi:hypothetical protein
LKRQALRRSEERGEPTINAAFKTFNRIHLPMVRWEWASNCQSIGIHRHTIRLRDAQAIPSQLGGPLHAKYKSVIVAFDRSRCIEQAKLWNALCSLDVCICGLAE